MLSVTPTLPARLALVPCLLIFTCCVVWAAPAWAEPPPGCVDLYEDPSFTGSSYRVCGDGDHWLPYDPGVVDWHYRVSSLICGASVDQVTLVDGNRPGIEATVSCRQGASLPGGDNLATNVVVQSVPADCVRLYEHVDLTGASLTFCGDGAHWLPYDPGVVDWHYRVSSFECGPGVATVEFINGNVPGQAVELACRGADQLASSFDNQTTNIDVEYAPACQPWDGSVPAVGTLLRVSNSVVLDETYGAGVERPELAGRYLVNVSHGGEPVPKFVSVNPDSKDTLYRVQEARTYPGGVEVRLQSPAVGLAALTTVGWNHRELVTSAHSYWPIHSEWVRLAHTYPCSDCPGGQGSKAAPRATLYRTLFDQACGQSYIYQYQFVQCEVGASAGSGIGEVLVEVCHIR